MARVKRGITSRKRHKKVLKLAKGFRGGLSKLFRPAKQAVIHSLKNATIHRRVKKRDFRSLWIMRMNAALREHNITYSKFVGLALNKGVIINRKMLSELAINHPDDFKVIVDTVTS